MIGFIKAFFSTMENRETGYIIPGGNRINLKEKQIFILVLLFSIQILFDINFMSLLSQNFQEKILYIFNLRILNIFSRISVGFFTLVIIVFLLEETRSKFENIKKFRWFIRIAEVQHFSEWIVTYFTLYFFIFVLVDFKSILSINSIYRSFFDTLICTISLLFIFIELCTIFHSLFIVKYENIAKTKSSNIDIAKNVLKVLKKQEQENIKSKNHDDNDSTDKIQKRDYDIFGERIKATNLIKIEIDLLEKGVDVEKIMKDYYS